MKYSQIKAIKTFTASLFSTPDYKEVLENVLNSIDDFEVDNVRFIKSDCIDQILADELESDSYCLGCFNSSFISDITGWPVMLIEAAQSGEAYEELGKAIADEGKMLEFAEAYASADGYGHHFNSYDFSEEDITINDIDYMVFDNQ